MLVTGTPAGASLNVPHTDAAVTATRCDVTSVTREIERVDILLMPAECLADGLGLNIPYLENDVSNNARLHN